MLNTYQVQVRDWNGAIVGVFAGTGKAKDVLSQVSCSRYTNQIGQHQIIFTGDLTQFVAWKLDYQVEVLRRTVVGWAKIYHGFHRSHVFQADSEGREQFITYGHDLKGLIARASIPSDTISLSSIKSGPADDVIKAYIRENIGPLAAVGRARLGVTVDADKSLAPTWSGSQARQSLFDAICEIALVNNVDFDIISTTPNVFQFVTYYPPLSVDRTIANTAGNKPVIFSLERNNMATPVTAESHGEEINTLYVLGQGEEDDRDVVEVSDAAAVNASPWNRIEAVRQNSNILKGNLTELAYAGIKELQANQAKESCAFTALQTALSTYGVHYFDGDRVTGLYHKAVDKRIVGVTFSVSGDQPQEVIQVELSDVR